MEKDAPECFGWWLFGACSGNDEGCFYYEPCFEAFKKAHHEGQFDHLYAQDAQEAAEAVDLIDLAVAHEIAESLREAELMKLPPI